MPTQKPRVTFTISQDKLSKIDSYRSNNQLKNQTQAVLSLIEKGLQDYSLNNKNKAPSYSDEAIKLAYDFDNRVDDWGRRHLRDTADFEIERYESEQDLIKKNEQQYKTEKLTPLQEQKIIYLPEPLQSASAGTGQIADDDTAEQVAVYYNKITSKADYIMRVSGDSMEPKFMNGDRVLVRSQPSVEIGEIGIFIVDGEQYVKIYRGSYLESLNPQYNDIEVSERSFCRGKVIGVLEPEWIAE